jgi:hypothetical protein
MGFRAGPPPANLILIMRPSCERRGGFELLARKGLSAPFLRKSSAPSALLALAHAVTEETPHVR